MACAPASDSRDLLLFERRLAEGGLRRIAGVDEAGRGPLAGPVVAAAVVFPLEWILGGLPDELRGLNDSKQVTVSRRETFHEFLTRNATVAWKVAVVEPVEIDRLNILRATHAAMVQAISGLPDPAAEHVLVDGLRVDAISTDQTALVRGDSRSYSIAAASILAKVTRDRLMVALDATWPGYGFARHKGYPTPDHLAALRRLGACPAHRRSFAPVSSLDHQPELFRS
ncbi:MAG: ribonuclease HII [Limisphaerales bacterium]